MSICRRRSEFTQQDTSFAGPAFVDHFRELLSCAVLQTVLASLGAGKVYSIGKRKVQLQHGNESCSHMTPPPTDWTSWKQNLHTATGRKSSSIRGSIPPQLLLQSSSCVNTFKRASSSLFCFSSASRSARTTAIFAWKRQIDWVKSAADCLSV